MTKRYEVNLSSSDSPILYLETELSIGKFGQNLNLDHPDLSQKHCTLFNNNGVLSIVDHGSEKGTFINGNRIPPQQPIMLEKNDMVAVGSLEVQIKKPILAEDTIIQQGKNTDIPELPDMPATRKLELEPNLEVEKPSAPIERTAVLNQESLVTEIQSEREFVNEQRSPRLKTPSPAANKKNKKKNPVKTRLGSKDWGIPYFIRLITLIIDINLAVFVTQFLTEYDALFLLKPIINEFSLIIADYAEPWTKYLVPYLIVYTGLILLGNLLLKRSVGKLLVFVSVEGGGLSSRIRAFARSILGLITWPFVIFDFPSLFSRPTVKEAIFSSRFYLQSKLISVVLAIVMLPLSFGAAYLTSFLERFPLEDFKSFEYKTINFGGTASEQGIISSRYFDFEKPKRSRTFLEYPYFRTVRKKNKRYFVPSVRVYYPTEKILVRFESTREKIDLKKMLSFAVRTNPLAFLRFGEIIKFIENEPYNELKFYEEFKSLTKSSLELRLSNLTEHLIQYGPFFKSFFDYRDSLMSSLDKRVRAIRFVKMGNKHFMKVTAPPGKFAENNLIEETFVPLERIEKPLLKFHIESSNTIPEETILKFYRGYFGGVEWRKIETPERLTRKTSAYEIIDYFSQKDSIKDNPLEEHSYIFRYYFKIGRLLAKSSNEALRDDYLQKLESFLNMIIGLNQKERKQQDRLRESSLEEAEYDRLIKKTNELIEALKSEDLSYFSFAPKPETPSTPIQATPTKP